METQPPDFNQCHTEQQEGTVNLGRRKRHALLALLLLAASATMAVQLINVPLNRIIELAFCRNYYLQHDPSVITPDGDVSEDLCKINPVQQKLAWLEGAIITTMNICDLVSAIPLGYVSDRYGRRLVLCLNLCALAVRLGGIMAISYFYRIFPIEAILAAPLFAIFGGGDCVFLSAVLAVIADLAADDIQRTTYMAWLVSASYVPTLLGPFLASTLMLYDLRLPFWLGLGIICMLLPAVAFLPEKHKEPPEKSPVTGHEEDETSSLLRTSSTANTVDAEVVHNIHDPQCGPGLPSNPPQQNQPLGWSWMGNQGFIFCLVASLIPALASSSTGLFLQFISRRYYWTFAHVGFLLSGKVLVNILLLTILVPAIRKSLQRMLDLTDLSTNIFCANSSIAISVLGAFLIAVSSTIWMLIPALFIYALGSSLPVFVLSMIKSPVIGIMTGSNDVQIYTLLIWLKVFGSLVGVPLMTLTWVEGIKHGGFALGSPYFLSAILYVVALCALWPLSRHLHRVELGSSDNE